MGKVKVVLQRSMPDGFKIKKLSTKKADGWAYVTLSFSTVPQDQTRFQSSRLMWG